MEQCNDGTLLKIYIGESDRHEGQPLYEWILQEARRRNLAGATVIRGLAGFGAKSMIHTSKILSLSQDLPIMIEIVDRKERIDSFLPLLKDVIKDGLVTEENIKIHLYRSS